MKKVLLTAALVLVATSAFAAISGTKHNLSSSGGQTYGGGSDQICKFCHVPHNATTAALLWSRSSNAAGAMYTSTTLNATGAVAGTQSTACLSCHSSTASTGYDASTAVATLKTSAIINDGSGLANDHPIGITYDAALVTADGGSGLKDPSTLTGAAGIVKLFSGKLECGSCHSVHDNTTSPFLRGTNAASALCLQCHNK